ncbi:hypothetical protein MBLNU459_g3425t1 [Dothideomycetes sp. NU459]
MYTTNRCTCSVRALEVFVREFAGLQIHSHTPRASSARLGTAVRRISTRPAFRIQQSRIARLGIQASASSVTGHDDSFVPFDFGGQETHDGRVQAGATLHDEARAAASAINGTENAGGFEPEVEIHRAGILEQTTGHQSTASEATPVLGSEAASLNEAPFNVDTPLCTNTTGPNSSVQTETSADVSAATRTRAENRKERKIRRMEARKVEEEQIKEQQRSAKAAAATEKKRQKRRQAKEASLALDVDSASPEALEKEFSALSAEQSVTAMKSAQASAQAPQPADVSQEEWRTEREAWMVQKAALDAKFGEQNWNPRKRISPDALAGIRALHSKQPDVYTTPVLAAHFKVSAEAIRRILKSRWQPNEEEVESRRSRWEKRGEKKWSEMVELGIRPPKKWREMGVGRVTGKGAVPAWKKAAHAGTTGRAGERWIEHARADVFELAGDVVAERSHAEPSIADRIL